MHRIRSCVFFVLLMAMSSFAQKVEVSGSAGWATSPDGRGQPTCGEAIFCPTPLPIGPLSVGSDIAWQASAAYRVTNLKAVALYAELPIGGIPSRSTGLFSEYSTLFFTPSLQVKFLPNSAVSPFASIGGGLARFSDRGRSDNTGALQFGGGLDFRTRFRPLAIRVEARDYVTGRPGIGDFAAFTSDHLQHIFAGGGFVLKF